jgi:hypothetical protein
MKKSQSEVEPDLRLTPTTLRRVMKQRDKLEEEMVELRAENVRLLKELEEHQHCGKRIEQLNEEVSKQQEKCSQKEKENIELKKEIESLKLINQSNKEMDDRSKENSLEMEKLARQIEALELRNMKLEAEVEEKSNQEPSITPQDFFRAIENFKIDQLMGCISERVFVHVVAPRTILQVGSGDHPLKKEFKPSIPSDEMIHNFIHREIEPHFTMVFKTLDQTSSSSSSSMMTNSGSKKGGSMPSVEDQLAPDGTSVKSYAERFNSSLSAFIKKCIQDS